MDYSDQLESLRMSLREICDGHGPYVFWRERVEIDGVGYLELYRFGEWVVRVIVDGCSLFVIFGAAFPVSCLLSLLLRLTFPNMLVLRDVLGWCHLYPALVLENLKTLFIDPAFRMPELYDERLVIALPLDF